jgi:hypothetical protein
MEYSDILLTLLTVCAVAVTVVAIKLVATLSRFGRLAERIEMAVPQAERLLVDAQGSARSLERLTDRAHDVAEDAQLLTAEARRDLVPLVHRLSRSGNSAADGLQHVAALVAATKAGFRAFRDNGHRSATADH